MGKFFKFLSKHRMSIYYIIILAFFLFGIYYAYKGYAYHQTLPAVQDNNDLLGRMFSPFILAIIRFLIVTLVGIFVAMILISNPLKRIKVMQFEVEFTELAKVQEKQVNQFNFLSTVLKENDTFLAWAIDEEDDSFKRTVTELLTKYEQFFETELDININAYISKYDPYASSFTQPEYNRMANKLAQQLKEENQFMTKKRIFGKTNLMMTVKDYYGQKYVVLIESEEHIFADYDREVLKSLLEYAIIICDTVDIMD